MKFQNIETGVIENFTDNFNHVFECKKDTKKESKVRAKENKERSLTLDLAIEKEGQMTLF
jgi:hypothetical protein